MSFGRRKAEDRVLLRNQRYYDIAALCLGVFLLVFFAVTVRLGVGMPDEAYYYTIPQRLLNGDRFFIEEWHLAQLSSLFAVLPYWIFTTVTGSTEGIILFMRCFFVGINMLFYGYLYLKLRAYGLGGLLSAFLFCAILPECNYAISYYTVSSMAIMIACINLFIIEEPKRFQIIGAGIFYALGVVAEPLLFFLYLIYSAAMLIRHIKQKKRPGPDDRFLCLRTWFFFSAGGFAVLAVLLFYLYVSGTLQDLSVTLPYLFTGREFNKDNFIDISKLTSVLDFFSVTSFVCIGVCFAILLLVLLFKKNDSRFRVIVFLLSCAAFSVSCVIGLYSVFSQPKENGVSSFMIYHDIPFMLIVPIWYCLCQKKNRRLFCFWLCGALYSLAVDISSNIMMGGGSRICLTAGLLILGTLLPELREGIGQATESQKASSRIKHWDRTLLTGVAFGVLVFAAWNMTFIGFEGYYKPAEKLYCESISGKPYVCTLSKGPYKNLKTNNKIQTVYLATLHDIDLIKQDATDEKFVAFTLNPYIYLYAQQPYACISTWDRNPVDRSILYWNLLEEQRPGYIYVSFYPFLYNYSLRYDQKDIDLLEEALGELEMTKGEAGYILKVNSENDN